MEGADVDESFIALDECIKNLNSGDGYESDECSSTVKSTTSHISGTSQRHYPTDEELSMCDSVASTKERSLSLRQTLNDERSSQRFLAFVKAQRCASNIKFWFACERFSKLGASRGAVNPHARDAAKAIYHHFLKNSAPQKVALKESTVNQIRRSLDLRLSVSPQLFAAAQQEVYDLMVENEYKQFLMMSGDYSDCSSQFTSSSILPAESYYSDNGSSIYSMSHAQNGSRVASGVHGDIETTSMASYSDSDGGSSLMGYGVPRVPNTSRGASAVHSDIESSIASYPDSEPSTLFRPRMLAPPRRVQQRNPHACVSDNETRVRQTRKTKQTSEKSCVTENFLRKVSDRLLAIKQDRDNMQKAVQEQASRRGQKMEEIQKLEWYDFPTYPKKYVFSRAGTGQASPVSLMVADKSNHSPQEDSSTLRSPSDNKHLDSMAEVELNKAMHHMEISNRQARLQQPADLQMITKSPALNFASVDSGLSDSGRSMSRYSSQLADDDMMLGHSSNSEGSGATLLPTVNTQTDSGLSSDPNPHVTRYLQQQNECSDRDKQAFAAASMLLDSNPHFNQPIVRSRAYMGQLNHFKTEGSQLSISDADTYRSDSEFYQSERVANWMKEQQRQQKQSRQPKFIRPQLTEESSSDFTMHSSTLFMPVGGPYHPCSDSDDPRYFNSHKVMHQPKRTAADRRRLNNTGSRNSGHHSSITSTTSTPSASKDPFAAKPGEPSIAVIYQLEGEDAPKRRVVADKDYTLVEFKKLFGKKGEYRYFFKQWCADIEMAVKDELIYDHDVIPRYQNKIFAFIEKCNT